ncbi:AAA family ATPase [Streptomyces roseoverticillatus]|uniref:helix-turn-helix transcriptional regulator n=1 Tax=Streptomyces roseoverticillatus TaxID=66429 RepID=UPI001F48BDDF|nr:LuxR family transcriptional regulator [Streptomyces roseoverticillatus]MCF3103066.1 AAA family ATPase [Streptomyces roseoverticillatus]
MTVGRISGREDELGALEGFLEDVRSGAGRSLVVRGEPGAGKSTLLRHTAGRAAPARVLTATGAEPESGMAFAALHQLLRPVAGLADALPGAQRDAVRAALGLAEPAAAQDGFLVSAGVLSLLAEAASTRGLVCVVDDFQWVDQSSADALLFAARRFGGGDGVGLLIGTRDGAGVRRALSTLPSLDLGGLDAASARDVLAERAAADPAPEVVEIVTAATGGNPLALRETARLLTPGQLAGRAPLPDPLPVGEGVAAVYGDRIVRLPEDTRLVLLAAALEGRGDARLIRAAAEQLGADPGALDVAEAAGIVEIRPPHVRFRHPLIRAAAHAGAAPAARRAVHRRLAGLLAEDGDHDRAARHCAEAATGPDEDVAADLAAAGERARARGGYADAAGLLARAAALTPDPAVRARRLTDTAAAAWLGGRPGRAHSALAAARDLAREPLLRAEIARLDARFELSSGNAAEALRTLLSAAEAAGAAGAAGAGVPEERARATRRIVLALLADAAEAASAVGDTEAAVRIGRRAAAVTAPPGVPEDAGDAFLRDVLTGMGALYDGDPDHGTHLLRRALAALPDEETGDDGPGHDHTSGTGPGLDSAGHDGFGPAPAGLGSAAESPAARLLWAAAAASLLGERDAAARYGARAGRVARVSGMVGTLPVVLENAATAERMNSGFALSAALSEEGLALAREAGLDNSAAAHLANLAVCAAVRGQEDECRARAQEALTIAIPHRLGLRAGVASYALGLLDLGLGRFDRAHERLTALAAAGPGTGHHLVVWGSAADRVEAAVAAGDIAAADAAAEFLGQWSAETASPRARALVARCRALVADDAEAPAFLRRALELLAADADQDAIAYDRARTELLLGERLRRDRRAAEARPHLRHAAEAFHRMGALPWERRARGELRAAGETAGPDGPAALDGLTAQELRIARLVAEGVSNRDVAARLFLSPRTVEYHLYKVYPKLGISSRTELARLLQ